MVQVLLALNSFAYTETHYLQTVPIAVWYDWEQMKQSDVFRLFDAFSQSTDNPLSRLSEFVEDEIKPEYYKRKEAAYKKNGLSHREAHNKARQSWVAFVGRILEKLIERSLVGFCDERGLNLTTDRVLRKNKLPKELDLVRRAVEVHFGDYSLLPDADIIIYTFDSNAEQVQIIAILSIKNSFRERFTETPYWKLKLQENPVTEDIKVFMVTPDNDDEVSFTNRYNKGPRKARIVMEYDLDGIYLAREEYDASNKVKGIEELEADLAKLIGK